MEDLTSPPPTSPSEEKDDTKHGAESLLSFQPVVLLLLLLIVANLTWNNLRPEPTWQYKIESIRDFDFDRSINASGKEGWELVFARRAASSETSTAKPDMLYEIIFKRKAR